MINYSLHYFITRCWKQLNLKMSRIQVKTLKYPESKNLNESSNEMEIKVELEIVNIKEEPEEHFVLFLPRPQRHFVKVENNSEEEQEDKYGKQIEFQTKVEVEKFKCQICEKSYTLKGSLATHKKIHFSSEKDKFECDKRNLKTFYKKSMKFHITTTHKNDQPFKCLHDICGKAFKTQTYLNRHQIMHSNVYKYECEECSRPFKTKGKLRQHRLRIHSGTYYKIYKLNTNKLIF